MSANQIAVRVIAAIGLAAIVAAVVYSLTSGHVFVLPFLLILGFPMGRLLGKRLPPAGSSLQQYDRRDPPEPPRPSLN
jgi:hypothetical protein